MRLKRVSQGCIQLLKIQNDKKILKGLVISAKNNKTIVVEVTRKFKHPFYEKVIKDQKNIMLMMRKINLKGKSFYYRM